MTVVAYKDGVMASDSLWHDAVTHGVMLGTKICRLRSGALYGRSGDGDDRELVELLQDVKTPEQLPTRARLREIKADLAVLLVLPTGSAWVIETEENDGSVDPAPQPHAVGCGAELAIGAMAAGAGARQAAKIACDLNALCREPIHTLKLAKAKR